MDGRRCALPRLSKQFIWSPVAGLVWYSCTAELRSAASDGVVCEDSGVASTKDVVPGYLQLAESASGEHACLPFRNLAWQPGCARSLHFYAIRAGPAVMFVLSTSLNITRAIKGLFGRELAHDNKMSTSRQTINFRRSLPLSSPSTTVWSAHTVPTEREPSLHRASSDDQY